MRLKSYGILTIEGKLPKGDGVMAIYANIANKTAMVTSPIITFLLSIVHVALKRSVEIIALKKWAC